MILYIILLLLFLFVLVSALVERKRILKKAKQFRQELNALNAMKTQLEWLKLKHSEQIEADLKLINRTPVLPSSTEMEAYRAYRNRGGTDDLKTWLFKSDLPNLFP